MIRSHSSEFCTLLLTDGDLDTNKEGFKCLLIECRDLVNHSFL